MARKSLGSTNDFAAKTANGAMLAHLAEGILVVADRQTSGRGRLGRAWHSPPGCNVYMSIAFLPAISQRKSPLLSLAAGLSSALAIKAVTGLDVRLKWPNDLLAGKSKKLGGILLETRSGPGRTQVSVAGIGINVNIPKESFPADIARTATSVFAETGEMADRNALIAAVCREFGYWLSVLRKEGEKGVQKLLKAYTGISDTIGRKVKIKAGEMEFEGTAAGIDQEGMLLMKLPGARQLKRVPAGEVQSLRAARR
ncbi:MAG: biotin--[acetyl-CoA-carboxylase] ligase [Nitrospiraceae bacterium]|nr:biotin--[acetyl-CoA-carboxylase] ligase [Nitrospiraceae bacterium]